MLTNNYFSGIRRNFIITMYKNRGLSTDLRNYRGIVLSCFLYSTASAFFTNKIQDYSTELGLIPSSQIATQKGVQARDLTSLLAQIQSWAERHRTTVYSIGRDQMKGFDLFNAQAGYDAYEFFGLPQTVAAFDRARIAKNSFVVKTPHGLTDSFDVEGLMKQGDATNPFRFALGMAPLSYWLKDQTLEDDLVLRTKLADSHQRHTYLDEITLPIRLLSAMDDTRLFALSLTTLERITYLSEQYQEAYGAKTDWKGKTTLSILGPKPVNTPDSQIFLTPSGTHAIPFAPFTFLRTEIDRPLSQFELLKTLIQNTVIPSTRSRRLPISAVARFLEQKLISVIRPKLALCPVTPTQALALDSEIANLVTRYFNWPLPLPAAILSNPLASFGLGMTSIWRLNGAQAISGLLRDLDHHYLQFQRAALITLADWQCSIGDCRFPLRGSATIPHRKACLPNAWITAAAYLSMLPDTGVVITDQHHLRKGDVSLVHFTKSMQAPANVVREAHKLSTFGLPRLADVAHTIQLVLGKPVIRPKSILVSSPIFTPCIATKRWLRGLTLADLVDGPATLLLPRQAQELGATLRIQAQASKILSQLAENPNVETAVWATDGSHFAAEGVQPARTGASVVSSLTSNFTIKLNIDAGILEAELAALIVAVLIARAAPERQHQVFTDHLNTVRLLEGTPRLRDLRATLPSRASQAWLLNLVRNTPNFSLTHVKAHTEQRDEASLLNKKADRVAKEAACRVDSFDMPFPTFYLPQYCLRAQGRWLQGSLTSYVEAALVRAVKLSPMLKKELNFLSFAGLRVPIYPYRKAVSTYSAETQLLLRSHRLPTADRIGAYFDDSRKCVSCGKSFETERHVFVECNAFIAMRVAAGERLKQRTAAAHLRLVPAASEDEVWLLANFAASLPFSQLFYRLVAPPSALVNTLPVKVRASLEMIWHHELMILTGQIWGTRMRNFYKTRK
jgi:ribonuclease HI